VLKAAKQKQKEKGFITILNRIPKSSHSNKES